MKCSKTVAEAGSLRVELPSASEVSAFFTVEQVVASTPLVFIASQAGILLDYLVTFTLVSKFDFINKGTIENIKKVYGVVSINAVPVPIISARVEVPKEGLQSTLNGGLYSAKATKAIDKMLALSSKIKANKIEKVKVMLTYLQALKDHAKIMHVNFHH